MDLKRKLAALKSAGPGQTRSDVPTEDGNVTPASSADAPDAAIADGNEPADGAPSSNTASSSREATISDLRARLHAMMARPRRSSVPTPAERRRAMDLALPFVSHAGDTGSLHLRAKVYDAASRHGLVPLHTARDASPMALATLALDEDLRGIDPRRVLFLDTETTGLAGGTGTIPFLIGVAFFDDTGLRVEQAFLADLHDERTMLQWVAQRFESASALVTFNGKAFDLPLIRTRFVLSRLAAPRELPHLDLLHVARRVYRERLEECRLTSIERSVLGFERQADVPSGEIPARYADFLRSGNAEPLAAVVDHNLWDLIAMAALMGELSARAEGSSAGGHFEPTDMTGMARTALRAGAEALAHGLADAAALESSRRGQSVTAARAHTVVAEVHRRRGEHDERLRRLLEALAAAPGDAVLHLAIAKHYEHKHKDPERALEHARRSRGADLDAAIDKRIARLEARIAKRSSKQAR